MVGGETMSASAQARAIAQTVPSGADLGWQ
jgi:hypothetical protein